MHGPLKSLAASRYIVLVEQLGRERDHRYGWKSEVARLLGVDPSYVQKLADKQRVSVGLEVVEKAMQRVPLLQAFFHDPAAGDAPDYRQFLAGRPPSDDDDRDAFETFYASPIGQAAKSDSTAVAYLEDPALRDLLRRFGGRLNAEVIQRWYDGYRAADKHGVKPGPEDARARAKLASDPTRRYVNASLFDRPMVARDAPAPTGNTPSTKPKTNPGKSTKATKKKPRS